MIWVMSGLTFLGGILNSLQSGCNATLNKSIGTPLLAAVIVALANCLVYLAVAPFIGFHLPDAKSFGQVPWWGWVGGVFGAVNVLNTIFFAERLGGAVFIGLVVTAGIVTSVAMDHYALVGYARHPAGVWRLAGCGLMLVGLGLVAAF